MTIAKHYPTATPDQQRLGRALYTAMANTLGSHVEWFGEGVPTEWVRALSSLNTVLQQCRRQAERAVQAEQDTRVEQQGVLL